MDWYKDGMYPEWHVCGTNFSPNKLKAQYPELILSNSNEKTDVASRGRINGQQYGYGSTQVVVPNEVIYKFFELINIEYAASMLPRKVIDDEGYTVGV